MLGRGPTTTLKGDSLTLPYESEVKRKYNEIQAASYKERIIHNENN